MKYLVMLGDGMADWHKGPLGNKTPLELAKKPAIDELAKTGQVGLIQTIDEGFLPGSDVANMSVIGFPPAECYTGRSPLEALAMGIPMSETDTVFRVNLVTLSDGDSIGERRMLDYSAGEITSEEASELIAAIGERLGNDAMQYYAGVSYRHCAVLHGSSVQTVFTPPHDILDKPIAEYLPSGMGGELFSGIIESSVKILEQHSVNQKRLAEGKSPANAIWFWGKGTKPNLPNFQERFGLKGALISAVDLLKGIALGSGMTFIPVEGANGTLDTNYLGKAKAAVDAVTEGGFDYIYIHVEAPDECGHKGDSDGKILAIERIDGMVDYMVERLKAEGEEFCLAVLPDHATPLQLRTHTREAVPYLVYHSMRPRNCGLTFTENEAQKGVYLSNGRALLQMMRKG